jgi:CheY-like chemotaxis protein
MDPRTSQSDPVRKTVLVVDGDPQSLRIVDVSLRRAGFDVRSASDGAAAAAIIERDPPDLVIADVALGDVDGFELCRLAKAHPKKPNIQFVFLARPNPANKIRSVELGAEDYLAKPVFVKEVISRVSILLQRNERERLASGDRIGDRVTGNLSDLSMIDLLQTIATNGKSGVVHLRGAGDSRGEVYFRRGAIVDAEAGRLSGSDAIYRLFSWTEGKFEIEWRNIRRRDTVTASAPALLMEGMRRIDEWTRLLQLMPPLETVFEVDYRLLAERLADIPDEVNGILRLFDGVRSVIRVIDDCGLSDLDALTVIGKLHGEGIVRNANAPTGDDEKSGPDLERWLTDSPNPFGAAANPTSGDHGKRASDRNPPSGIHNPPSGIHRRPTVPVELLDAPSAAGSPSVDRRDRSTDRLYSEGQQPATAAVPDHRAEEPAVVIPFPSSSPPAMRQTLVSPSGGPAAAVAGEITNGVPSPASSGESAAPAIAAGVSTPRATDPGLGPVPPFAQDAAGGAASSSPSGATTAVPVDEPAPARRDSSPKVPELPFSDSASRWMSEGDEIHQGRHKSEALDELALPSRFRGLLLVAAAVVVAGGTILVMRSLRSTPPAEPVVAASVPAPAPPPPVAPAPAPPAPPPAAAPPAPTVANGEPAPAPKPAAAAAPNPKLAAAPEGEAAFAASDFPQLLELCQTAFANGRMKDATAACAAAQQANPESATAMGLLSHAEFNRNHRKEALSWAEKAVKVDPKLADAYVIIGGVQQDAGHKGEARAAYRKYLDLAPKGQYASDLRAIIDTL